MQSYAYTQREGVAEISWERFAALAAQLTERLAEARVTMIVGVARAGLFPATAAACSLRCELTPVRVTRRVNDQVMFAEPVWRVDVAAEVAGQIVAVVDEIADTGATLHLVAERVRARGAARVITAALVAHSWARPRPDLAALITDALVIFPWDQRVYSEGAWRPHPEIVAALRQQGTNSSHGEAAGA